MARTLTHSQRVARDLVRIVDRDLGEGRKYLSPIIRRALVHEKIMYVMLSQDESSSAATVLRYARELCEAADEILEGK